MKNQQTHLTGTLENCTSVKHKQYKNPDGEKIINVNYDFNWQTRTKRSANNRQLKKFHFLDEAKKKY